MDSMEEVQQAESLLNQTRKAGSIIVEEYNEETGDLTRKLITQADAERDWLKHRIRSIQRRRK